ncbi:polysaccharide deacetylase family protein [Halobacillus karajensis]|uniref:Bifunctional xylanase/deacetylase n=1 Tax=Halobacillus karajensis TaxID=195088 RepID=A0A024P822_9BACI|nr:polysaccharide deacetylase family protein [Halobacillus karajensis]CDQ20933.1 Bifunctional xylanase/deacetylase precursor [Halobacillus karajensis]CDQ25003.1 Bifunctional xylanase/deacetylase precursor [Halobacillus karajensis]CDQ28636.1 Bifunctional xylanase/deacetylase precursor [Halobacillus karajensis]
MKKKLWITGFIFLLMLALVYGIYQWMNARSFQVFGHLTDQVETNEKVVALTFDDGPTEHVGDLLGLLQQYEAKSTFFLIGKDMEDNMEKAQEIVEAGHQVGNHTYSHEKMVFKSYAFYKKELNRTNELIRESGYEGKIDFRPPYGKKLFGLPYYLKQKNMDTITWDLEPDTFYSTVEDKVTYVNENVKKGSIILLHPMYGERKKALATVEGILKSLTEKGYSFVTVDELQRYEEE